MHDMGTKESGGIDLGINPHGYIQGKGVRKCTIKRKKTARVTNGARELYFHIWRSEIRSFSITPHIIY